MIGPKIHEYRGRLGDILPLSKWLRASGVNGVDYKIHQSNYSLIKVEFMNSKLELHYIMKWNWGSGGGGSI